MPLPTLVILATGGTIAGSAAHADDSTSYQAATLPVQALIEAVPPLQGMPVRLVLRQVLQKDSKDMDACDWLSIAAAVQEALTEPDLAGIVITHGTDTLEETAWFLHRVLPPPSRPVVLTSAMRPATALAADGPQNLLDACTVALDGRLAGVVCVAAGRIHAATTVQKLQPYRIPAFGPDDTGPPGWIEDSRVRLTPGADSAAALNPPLWPAGVHSRLLAPATPLPAPPAVAWVTSHAGFEPRQIHALADAGFAGLLVAGTGNATLHHALHQALLSVQARGMVVALASRCPLGLPLAPRQPGPWRLLALPPAKARLEMVMELWKQEPDH